MEQVEEIKAAIVADIRDGSVYKHTKSGKEYVVISTGHFRDANSGEYLIIYASADDPLSGMWAHKFSEFTKLNEDGSKRFELMTRAKEGWTPVCLIPN